MLKTKPIKLILFLILLVCATSKAYPNRFEGKDYIIARFLLNENPSDQKKGAKELHRLVPNNPLLYDLAAKRLSDATEKATFDIDTQAWFYKAISSSASKRYLPFFESSIAGKDNRKLLKYYEASAKLLTKEATEYFDASEIDLQPLKDELEKTQKASVKPRSYDTLSQLEDCTPASEVFSIFGYPEDFSSATVTKKVPYTRVRMKKHAFLYEDFALLLMTQQPGIGWCYQKSLPVRQINSTLDQSASSITFAEIREGLWNWEYLTLHSTAHEIMQHHSDNQQILDEVMLRIWWGRQENDAETANALRYLIKALRHSKSTRYVAAMNTVYQDAVNKKFKATAKKYLKKTVASGEQFVPNISAFNP